MLNAPLPKEFNRQVHRPRRVLQVCPYMHHSAGGPPIVVARLAENGRQYGWEASILTTSFMCPDDGSELAADLGSRFEIEIIPLDRPRFLGHASKAAAAMDRAVRAADIVHIHTLWHPLNSVARRACQRHGIPYVLSPHGMLDPVAMSMHPIRKSFYLRFVENHNIDGASSIFFATDEERERAIRTLGNLVHSEVVRLGADRPPGVCGATTSDRFPHGLGGNRMVFLSRLHPKKNLETVLESMKLIVGRNPRAHLYVVGSGESDYEKFLKHRVRQLGVSSSVTFTGFLRGEEKWAAISAADVFVLPSLQENFGVSIAEALRAGVPVIVGDGVNIASEIARANAGRVLKDCRSAVELAGLVIEIFQNQELRRQMAHNALRLARGRFSWSETARRHCELYDGTLSLGMAKQAVA